MLKNSLKALLRKTNLQVVFASLDRSVMFFRFCNPVDVSTSCVHTCFLDSQTPLDAHLLFLYISIVKNV